MKKDIKILIIPDVHGRDFWRKPVQDTLANPDYKDTKIVFLGDYVDPYPKEKISGDKVVDTLTEIIDIKKNNDNVVLLLGNHDAGYGVNIRICECRHDWMKHSTLAELIGGNIDLFDIAYEQTVNKKRFLFSHAGVKFGTWIKYNTYIFPKGFRVTAKNLNEMFHSDDEGTRHGFAIALRDISYRRGGYEAYGSIVWADLEEFLGSADLHRTKRIQIVGHTMLKNTAINLEDKLYCLDCKKAFYIDSNGDVRYYDTDEIVKRHE